MPYPVPLYFQILAEALKGHAQTDKIMTNSSAITNPLSITMAGLIIDYLFSSD